MEWIKLNNMAHDADAEREIHTLLREFKNYPDKWNKIYTYERYI